MKSIRFAVVLLFFFIAGCITVDYEGKKYPPTDKVDVYMIKDEVPKDLVIIGKATAYAPSEEYSFTKIKAKLVEKAKEEGADAIFIKEITEKSTGTVRSNESELIDDTSWGMSGDSEGDIKETDYYFQDLAEGKAIAAKTFSVKVKTIFFKKIEKK